MIGTWVTFLTPLILCTAGVLIFAAGRVIRRPGLWQAVSLSAILVAGGAAYVIAGQDPSQQPWGRFGAASLAGLLFVGGLICLMMGPGEREARAADTHGLFLVGLAGALLVAVVDDAILLLVGLELCGFAGVGLIVISTDRTDARELASTGLALQATAAMLLLLGVVLLCAGCETTSLRVCRELFVAASESEGGGGLLWAKAALVLIVAGLAVRLLFVPFHFGSPQVLAKSSMTAAAYSLVIVRAAALIALFRLAMRTMVGYETAALVIAIVLSAGTMLVGTALALNRSRVRETIIWLVIGHGGVVLFGLAAAWGRTSSSTVGIPVSSALLRGEAAAGLSAIVSLLSAAGILAVLQFLRRNDGPLTFVDELQGLFRTRPLAAAAMAVLLLNLVGVPPLPGFWARLWTLLSALSIARESADAVLTPHPAFVVLAMMLAIQILLSAVVAWRIIAVMLFEPPVGQLPAEGGRSALLSAVICALLTLVMGFAPTKTVGWLDAVIPRPGNEPASSAASEGKSLAESSR